MKGKLYRKTEGWMVFYVEKNSAYTSTSYQKSLPLHPDNSTVILYEKHPLDWDGKEVDFEIVNESWDGYRGCVYAKLTNHIVDTNEIVDQVPDISKMVEDDVEKFATKWINENSHKWSNNTDEVGDNYGSFVAGWNKCKETLYTEEQVREAMYKARDIKFVTYSDDEIVESLKQPKK